MAVLRGDALGALRAIEAARAAAGTEAGDLARVHACAAEVYALLGRFEAAADELAEANARGGRSADVLRATGIAMILQPGGATQGLEQLEAAHELDPGTPFLDRPLSQAYLLEGRRLLAAGDERAAMRCALRAGEHDPEELDVKELEADCRQVLNDFAGALAILAELHAAGRDTLAMQAELHQRAGTYELFHKNRAAAVEHYRAARGLGLDDETLGFGVTVLAEEAEHHVARGVEAYDAGDLAGAQEAFRAALEVDATHLAARNHLAVVLFHEEDYAGAAEAWGAVLERALAADVELPEPVELNLARAQKLAGLDAAARATIEEFLARAPESPWAAEAEEMLRRL
jgi:Tfp pilus assembly protein PilF